MLSFSFTRRPFFLGALLVSLAVPSVGRAQTASAPPAVLVLATVPGIDFVDNGTGYPPNGNLSASAIEKRRRHAMPPEAIALPDRAALQAQVADQMLEATGALGRRLSLAIQPASLPGGGADVLADAVLSPRETRWTAQSGAAPVLTRTFGSGVGQVIVLRVDQIAHHSGYMFYHKGVRRYRGLDAQVTGRIALPDGRLLPLHTVHVRLNSNGVASASQQRALVVQTVDRLATQLADDVAHVAKREESANR